MHSDHDHDHGVLGSVVVLEFLIGCLLGFALLFLLVAAEVPNQMAGLAGAFADDAGTVGLRSILANLAAI